MGAEKAEKKEKAEKAEKEEKAKKAENGGHCKVTLVAGYKCECDKNYLGDDMFQLSSEKRAFSVGLCEVVRCPNWLPRVLAQQVQAMFPEVRQEASQERPSEVPDARLREGG